MPIYDLISESTGRSYRVNAPRELTDDEVAFETERYDRQAQLAEQSKPFLDVTDLASSVGSAFGGLRKTLPASIQRLRVGLNRPDTYPEGAKRAFSEEKEFSDQTARENTYRLLTGNLGSVGESIREAGPSLGFSLASMGAAIPSSVAGGVAGTAIGGPVGGVIGGTTAGMAASGVAAYRMAGSQFLNEAFNTYLQNNPGVDEDTKEAAYQELLPLAQNSALWEAGPEAIGNAATMGAGKILLGIGRKGLEKIARSALAKTGAVVGAQATELATETATQLGQGLPQAKADAFNRGEDMATARSPYTSNEAGAIQAFKDVAPQTLALGGLMLGAGGAIKGGQRLFQGSPTIEGDALIPAETPPVEEPEDDYGVAAFQQEIADIAAQPDPIAPLPPPIEDVPAVIYDLRSAETGEALDLDQIELALDIAEVKLKQGKPIDWPIDWPRDRFWLPNVSTASVRSLQQLVGSQVGIDAMRSRINQLRQQEAKGSTDPIAPIQQIVTKAAESSVRVNANVLPATAAVIEAGGLAPQRETLDQARARIRRGLNAEERADMEERLAQAEDEGVLADVFAEERRKAVAREDFLRRQQDLEAERQRLADEGILGDVFAEERQRATAREQQRQQPPVVEETVAPIQPVPVVEETGAPQESAARKPRKFAVNPASDFINEQRIEADLQQRQSDWREKQTERITSKDIITADWEKIRDDIQRGRRGLTVEKALAMVNDAFDKKVIPKQWHDILTARISSTQRPVEETVAPEITPEQVPNVENVIDEPGAAEVELGMEELTIPETLRKKLTLPYAAVSVTDLEVIPASTWSRRRDFLEGKARLNAQEKQELQKTNKQNWNTYQYNENARINEVAASLRAAIQDMQLARPDLEAELRAKAATQAEGTRTSQTKRGTTSEIRATTADAGRTGGKLQPPPETLQRVGDKPESATPQPKTNKEQPVLLRSVQGLMLSEGEAAITGWFQEGESGLTDALSRFRGESSVKGSTLEDITSTLDSVLEEWGADKKYRDSARKKMIALEDRFYSSEETPVQATAPTPTVPAEVELEMEKTPVSQIKNAPKRINLSGAAFDVVAVNEDGTLRVRNDEGGEFDTSEGESWTEVIPSSKTSASDITKMSRAEFIKKEIDAAVFAKKLAIQEAEQAIRNKWKPKKPLPVGVSKIAAFLTKTHYTPDEKKLMHAYNFAQRMRGAEAVRDISETKGAMWDALSRKQKEAETPVQATAPTPTVQRDVTKPEQMTPEERRDAKIQVIAVETEKGLKPIYYLAIREGDSIGIYGSNYSETYGELIGSAKPVNLIARPTLEEVRQAGSSAPAFIEKLAIDEGAPIYRANGIGVQAAHQAEIANARLKKAPVSKAAVDAYKITLPEGYVRQGDLYVFQPSGTVEAVAEEKAPAKPKNMAGEVRPERAKPTPAPEFTTLHPKSQEKFNTAFEAKDAGAMNSLLDPMNKGSRAEFESRTGMKLPATQKGTRDSVETWAATTPVDDLTDTELDRDLLRLGEYSKKTYASDALKARALELAKEFQKRQDVAATKPAETELAQVGDEVTWRAAGREARGTVYAVRGDSADIDYFGPKTVPLSELSIVRKSGRRLAQEKRDAEAAASTAQKKPQEPKQPKPKSKFTKAEVASLEQGKTPEGWTLSVGEPVTVTDTKGKTWRVKTQYSPTRTMTLVSGDEVQTFDVQTAPQPKPAAEVETPVAGVPSLEVFTGADAETADVRLALHRADKHYTLWISHKQKNGKYASYDYLTILGQDFDAAYDKALQYTSSLAKGDKLSAAFAGKNLVGIREGDASIGLLDKALTKGELDSIEDASPMGKQLVGFGKYSSLTVDEMVAKDIGYADWVANNASTGRGAKVAQYIRERNPAYIEWRDAKNVQDATKESAGQSEKERIKAFEQRATQKPATKPLDTENTTTDNKVVAKSTPKLASRKAKDQIVDIVPAQDSPSYVPESLTKNMFPSQVSGANAVIDALEKTGAALNGDGAGVGKTRQILAVASHYAAQGKPVVIITENAAIGKPWEGAKGNTNPTLGGSMSKDGQAMGVDVKLMPDAGFTGPGIYISTYNRVTDAQIPEGAVLIFDESQGLVNVYDDADPNKELGQWQQKFRTILDKAEKTAFYSATPADKPHQMSYLYKVLRYDSPQDFLVDARKNGLTIKTTKFGKTETKKYDIPFSSVKRTMLFRWVNNLMKKAGLSGSFIKREISYEGTDTQFHDVQGTDASKNPWAEKFNDVVDELESYQRNGWRLLAPDSYLLYAAELSKIGEAVRIVKRELAAGRKAVLYFSRIKEQEIRGREFLGFDREGSPMWSDVTVLGTIPSPVDLLRAELEKEGIGFTELHSKSGDTSATAQKKFAGSTDVLLASVESGGTGINLDDPTGKTPRTEVFMFAPYRGISTVQAMGRIWRASTVQDDSKPNRYVFLVASDIKQDAMRSAILAKKLQLMDASLGGTAVNRLPMSKVNYSPDQLAGMELPEEGVEVERIEADKTKELKPVNIEFKRSQKGNLWANANADLLEWYEAGGPERTGLNISVFQAKEDGKVVPGKWIALSEKQYSPEEFALPAETSAAQETAPKKEESDYGESNIGVSKETADAAAARMRKNIGSIANMGGMLNPTILKDAITIGAFHLEAGARSFADFSAKMIEEFGEGVRKYLQPAYEALRKRTDIDTSGMDPVEGVETPPKAEEPKTPPPPAPRAEAPKEATTQEAPKPEVPKPAPTQEPDVVAIANDPVDAQREALGLPPIMRKTQEAYTFPQMWSDAEAAMQANPERGKALVKALNDKPRNISALEDAILLRERVNRVNALDLAMVEFNQAPKGNNEDQRKALDDAITSLTDLDNALAVAGTEQGRSLNARKMLARQDYTLAKMITTLRAANDGNLSETDVATVTRLQKQIDETQKKLAEVESGQAARLAEAEKVAFEAGRQEVLKDIEERAKADAAKVAEMQKRKAEHLAKKKEAEKKPSVLDDFEKSIEQRIASRRGKLYSDVLLLNAAADAADYVLLGAVKIAKGITKLGDWVASMRGSGIELTDDEMQQLFKESKAFDAGEDLPASEAPLKVKKAKAPAIDKVKAIAADEEALDSRTVYNLVVEKMKKRVEENPALEKVEMSPDDLTSIISEVTKDIQEFFPNITEREIRDLFSGYGTILEPSKDELAKQMRQLTALGRLNSAIEDAIANIAPLKSGVQRDRATQAIRLQQKKLARELRMMGRDYEAGEEQLRSPLDAIKARLNNQIDDLAMEINTRKKIARRPTTDYDLEAKELAELRDELKRISDFINAPAGPTFTELVNEEMKKLDTRIAELQKTLAEGNFAKKEDELLHTAELDAKRAVRDALNNTLQKKRREAADKLRTQEDIDKEALEAVEEAITELNRKIEVEDYALPQRRTPTQTAQYEARVNEKKRLQQKVREEREKLFGRKGMTDEQRIKQATAAVDKSIERMQKMLTSGNYDVPKRTSKTPETPELAQKRETRDKLRKQLLELRKLKRDALIDPIAKQLKTDKKRIQTRMDKLKKRMETGDFSKPVKRQKATDDELLALQVEEENLKEAWAKMVFERQLASRGPGKRLLDAGQQTLNTARALITSFDVSAVFRQGGFIVLGNPLRGLRNLGPMFKAFGDAEFAKAEKFRMERRENYKNGLYQQSKLFLTDTGKVNQMNAQEEAFMSRWIDKLPKGAKGLYIGSAVQGSQRAYTVFLNRLRMDTFDAMVANLKKGDVPTPQEVAASARFINTATGRGDLGKFNQAGTMLNTVFFAPRLVWSRFLLLAGHPYFTASGRTKALVLREYAKFFAGASVVYALGALAQGDDDEPIETDPRSSDFLKIRFGDTRVDPLSGLIQATVLVSRLASGEKKQASGKIVPIRGEKVPYGADDSFDVMSNFARTKFSPIVGSLVNVITGKNVVDETTDAVEETKRMLIPMSFTEMKETFEAQGIPEATALTMLQLFGMGVQTYTQGKK